MWILLLALLIQTPNVPPDTLLEQGAQALDAKQYDRAVQLFTQAAAADPKDYAAEFQLALTYSLLKRDVDAIPHYQAALRFNPGMYEAELNLALSLVRTHDPAGAVPHFRAAVAKKPQEFRPALGLAQALYDAQQYTDAEASFKNAIALNSHSAPAESGWARSLAKQNRLDEAAPHFQQAFTLDPTYHSGLLELATLYEANHHGKEAIAVYRMFPDDPVAMEHVGALLMQAGETADAIQTLRALVEKMPTSERRIALAQAYVANKEPQKAQAAVAPAVDAAPRDLELRLFYARLLRDQRKFPEAAEQFAAVTQLKQDSVEAWNELAAALVITEQYPQALAAFDRLHALGAESTGNYFFRALSLDHLQQRPQAVESYTKFLAAAQGKFPDQEFQARQRVRILKNEIEKRK